MRFVLSYSGGKDSILALHHMVANGHTPAALLVMFRRKEERSWVHGLDRDMLAALSGALRLPLLCCGAQAENYAAEMENCLRQAADMGAEACVFGDIDTQEHRAWDEARCAAVGLQAVLPLWGRDREENVREAVVLGYQCVIKCIRNDMLPERFLGQSLSLDLLDDLRAYGIDLCGENGEYHTVVVNGPLFHYPVSWKNCGTIRSGRISIADLAVEEGDPL